jgi:hypothetical protein
MHGVGKIRERPADSRHVPLLVQRIRAPTILLGPMRWHPGLTVSVLLTFCRWSPTLVQNICRSVVRRQRLIYYKGRSTF